MLNGADLTLRLLKTALSSGAVEIPEDKKPPFRLTSSAIRGEALHEVLYCPSWTPATGWMSG
jgi:hypothetical protein